MNSIVADRPIRVEVAYALPDEQLILQVEGEAVSRWTLADPSRATVEPPEIAAATDAGAGGDPRGIKATGHIAIFRDFIRAVQADGQPEIDGLEGRRSLAAVLAVYEAAGLLK